MNGLAGPNPTETVTGGKTLELSKYDKIRRPHKAIVDDTKIKVTARTLSTELCCPICLDLLTSTMTTKECLHRFCSECITTALMRGNKECPTCRKKIVSKRSLRPDPNFDLLISKIWPDRKQYDAELSASMQLFQEQSNVQSLQKSIEEGIKAQAAYRKQRIQGSYDYEKRKRRPPTKLDAGQQPGGEDASELVATSGANLVDQVTVSLTPANVDEKNMTVDSPMDSDVSNEEDSDDADLSSDDSSSLSSDSTISSSSSSISTVRPSPQRSITAPLAEEQSEPASPMEAAECQASIDQMVDEMRRKGEDMEVELAPSRTMLQNIDLLPTPLKTPRYIRAMANTTIAAIAEFLRHLINQAAAISPPSPSAAQSLEQTTETSNSSCGPQKASPFPSASTTQPQQQIRPEHFYIVDRCHQLRKLAPSDCLAFALLNSIQWDNHLVIFYSNSEPSGTDENPLEMATVIGEQMAKLVQECPNTGADNQPNSQITPTPTENSQSKIVDKCEQQQHEVSSTESSNAIPVEQKPIELEGITRKEEDQKEETSEGIGTEK